MPPKTTTAPVKTVEVKAYEFPFTLGADPEFTIISGTRPVNAREMLKTFIGGAFTENQLGYELPGGNVGWDGHNATGEVRPKPGSPREVTRNFKQMFEEVQKRMPFVDLTTLTVAASTGGHIHLSVPESMNRDLVDQTPRMKAMERALGSFLLTVMLSENRLSRELRKRGSNYGNLLDFRFDQRFTHPTGTPGYTIEIRAATAEWITTERICLGTLAFMAICWDRIIQHFEGDKSALKPVSDILFPSQKAAQEGLIPLLSNYANLQKLYLNKIKPFVRSHPAYPEYKDVLELVMSPERSVAQKKTSHYSISEGWGLSKDVKSIKSADFTKDTLVDDLSSKFPEAVIRNLSSFAWNEDLNVQAFATALGKRCIALGWKPNHEYYLFGMKKGIDGLVIRDEAGEFLDAGGSIETKADFDTVAKTFKRLEPKAVPAYGRFIHPRTGELMKDSELKRVMIGLPHAMRQKMDLKPLVKLVLKYEKNPKQLPVVCRDLLPEGEGKLTSALKEGEEHEQGFARAVSMGEAPREVHPDAVAEVREMADAAREPFPREDVVDIRNLRVWLNRVGTFGFGRAIEFGEHLPGGLRDASILIDARPDDILGWYGGSIDTLVNLGNETSLVARFVNYVFPNVDEGLFMRSLAGAWRTYGRAEIRSYNEALKDARVEEIINGNRTF